MSIDFNKGVMESNFPLLDRFRELAPGSFKHCQNVSDICEAIANELSSLNLDTDLLRCAGIYHDIGKMANPLFFSENQPDEKNIHDDLPPHISCQLITRHVGDSVLFLIQEPEIPTEIIPIVSQHHGNTVLRSIFAKSKGDNEDIYRYKGKVPQTSEAGILMIVDSVEATARAMFNNGKSDFVTTAINTTIDTLIEDDQLDTMKIGLLKMVKKVLQKELDAIYHKRVVYDNKNGKDKKVKDVEKVEITEDPPDI